MSKKPSERKSNSKNNTEYISEPFQHKVTLTKENILENINVNIKCKSENQKKLINLIKEKEVIVCSGPAGCGKTYLSCAEAIKLLKLNIGYNKIVLIKSVITLKTEEIGWLKGTVEDKLQGVMFSFMYNFEKLIGKEKTDKLKEFGLIEAIPIAFMRGINIDNAIIIVDEVQNISLENMRTILTRIGYNSKMILLGDMNQSDIKNKKESSLKFLLSKFKNIQEIGVVELDFNDIVRNPIIKKIERVFFEQETIIQPRQPLAMPKPNLFTKFVNWVKSITIN